MVRSVIPDSDEDSGQEISSYDFTSTLPPAGFKQQSPSLQTAVPNHDNADILATTTHDGAIAQLNLGTGSTDSALFQQIYNQHQLSTDATLPTPVSQPDDQEQIISTVPRCSSATNTLKVAQSASLPPQDRDSSSATSSSTTINKLKRSKTNIQDSSFTSPEASKNQSKMRRAKSMKAYTHIIEGSSQDITVNIADTDEYTKLSQNTFTYRKVQSEKQVLNQEAGNARGKERDVYDFPGSSDGIGMVMKQITKKAGSKTTMDLQKEKKTYGKVRRTKTMIPPSSSPNEPREDARRDSGGGQGINLNSARLPSSPPVQEQAPKSKLAENIQRKKEEKAAAEREKAMSGATQFGEGVEAEAITKAKSPIKTYGKIKRSKTGIPSSSQSAADIDSSKRSADDSQLVDKHMKRKSDAKPDEEEAFELPKAKRFQKSKSAREASAFIAKKHSRPSEVVVLSSSQDDPVDQIPDTVVTPTASMPEPLLKSSTSTVLVLGTKSQEQISASYPQKLKGTTQVDSDTSVLVGSSVSVVKATKSSGDKSSGDKSFGGKPSSTVQGHPGIPKLPCFDSSQEQAEAVRSVIQKVDEIVNSPAPVIAPHSKSDTSSPLVISFDKGLVGTSIVLVSEPTDSQKRQYVAVSVTGSEGSAAEHAPSLPQVMSPATIEKWSGASSTVANSTWKDRDSGGNGDKRAPNVEPLSSQPRPSSKKATKRSKTGLERPTASRRGRSASVNSDNPPSSFGSDFGVRSSSRKVGRRKTMASDDGPAKSSSQPRKAHVVKTITTYEKLKDADAAPPSFPEVNASSEVVMPNTQAESTRGTKRTSHVAELDFPAEEEKSLGMTQEDLDHEMAKRLQEEMDKNEAEPATRAKRRAPSKPEIDLEPQPLGSQDAGLPPPEMYKPRLSSRRSKSLSAKVDPHIVETFIDGLPRPKKGKGKKAVKEKEGSATQEAKVLDMENVEPPEEPMEDVSAAKTIADVVMEHSTAPVNGDKELVVATEMPKSFSNNVKPADESIVAKKLYPVPKKIGRTASKPSAAAAAHEGDGDLVVALKKRGRGAKAAIDTDDSDDELAVMEMDIETQVPKAPVGGRAAAQKRTASNAAASKPAPKSKEILDTDDEDKHENEDLPVKLAGRSNRSKKAEKPAAKSKEIVGTDDDEDQEEPVKAASPVKAPPPAPAGVAPMPVAKARGLMRKTSTPGFKAPTMTTNKSTSADAGVPQTPRKDEPAGSQELTPKSTPPGTVSHSPLRGGVVPLRVGLSKKTRLPSLLKIIRK